MDPPFTKLDILSCRNLLIYLSLEVQKKLIPLFHYSLSPGGILLLGTAETIGDCPSFLKRSTANRGSSGGRNPSWDRSKLSFPRPLGWVQLQAPRNVRRPHCRSASSPWRINWSCSVTPASGAHQ